VANLASIRDEFRDLDTRLTNGARLGLAALAGVSFAVTFAAGSRTSHPPQRGLPPTPVAERVSDVGPALASRFEAIRLLPDVLLPRAVATRVAAPRPSPPVRRVTVTPRVRTTSSAVAPPAAQPVRRRIVPQPQPRTPAPPRPSRPAPAPQTFDSSGTTFDSSG